MFFRPLGQTPKNVVSQTSKETGKDDEDAKISRKWGEDNERLLFIWREFLRSLSSPSSSLSSSGIFAAASVAAAAAFPASHVYLRTGGDAEASIISIGFRCCSRKVSLPLLLSHARISQKKRTTLEEEKHSNRHLCDCRQSELVTETPRIFHPGGASPGARHAPRTNEKPKLT